MTMPMNHFKIKLLLIVTLLFPFIPTTAMSAAGKHALLIGIQDYSGTGFHSLKGPVNDIHLTQGMLRQRFGIANQNLITLLDAQATHTGIEQAFQALIKRVKPHDFVYIHYSGHGSQTADLNGDEKRGKHDQTWVSYGARSNNQAHKDNYDVLDDEINAWMAALYAKTNQIVFVSDSCHSATVSRGAELIRAVDQDNRQHILGKRRYTQTTYRGIRVGSARDFESAIGKSRGNGQYYGAFTWHWVRNLQQAQSGDTWEHIYKRTYAQVTAERHFAQQPQIEGEHRQQVLGGGFTPQPPTISVEKITHNRSMLRAGSLSGVTKGTVYRLYKPHHPNPQSLPSLTIVQVKPFTSYGKATGTFKTGDLVEEVSHVYHFEPIKVLLEADDPNGKDKPLLQAIQAAFQPHYGGRNFPAYRLTSDLFQSDLRLDIVRPKHNQAPELWVLTPDGRLFNPKLKMSFHDTEKGIQLLQDNLNKWARIRELKNLQSHRSRALPVTLQSLLLTPDKNCISGPDCVELSKDLGMYRKIGHYTLSEIEKLTLNEGDFLTFSLHNRSKRRYYCYIFNISPNGAIYSIFPQPDDQLEYARVNAGETRDLIKDIAFMAELLGEESLKFIISRYSIDVNLLEQEAFEQRGGEFNLSELLLFAHALYGNRGPRSLRNDEWATGLATFEVR